MVQNETRSAIAYQLRFVAPSTELWEEMIPRRIHWSREQAHFLQENGLIEGRWELIDGDILGKMGQNPRHRISVTLLNAYLTSVFPALQVQIQGPIDVGELEQQYNEPEPDAVVLNRPTTAFTRGNPPIDAVLLIVEVSDTTLRFDLSRKASLYARAGSPDYWVLDVVKRQLYLHRNPDAVSGIFHDITIYEDAAVAPLAAIEANITVSQLLPPAKINIMSNEASKVRWGVFRASRIFERRMAPAFKTARNAELVAIASRTAEKAQASAEQHGIPHAFGSYDALLADPDIGAVYIPLPNNQHREWTLRALEAGKHVLCDKPAALSYGDAVLMADTAHSANLRLLEGFMWRHHPQHSRIRELVAEGVIGDVVHFRGVFAYPAVRDGNNIRSRQQEAGGGAFMDVGVYPVNAARYHFDAEPVAVYAVWKNTDPEFGIDVNTVGVLEFADGRTASITCGFDQAFASRYEIVGDKGSITAERGFQIGEKGVTVTIRLGNSEIKTEDVPHLDQYMRRGGLLGVYFG